MKMLIEINMDGYDLESSESFKQYERDCQEYVEEQLNSTAISCQILWTEKLEP